MRSQTRIIATAFILLLFILGFYRSKLNQIPDYLPQEAHDYFHGSQPANQTSGSESAPQKTKLDLILDEFSQRPVQSYEDAVSESQKTCPTEGVNFDIGAVTDNEQRWRELPDSQIASWRKNIVTHLLQKQSEALAKPEKHEGRGIVMAAGDRYAVVRAQTNVRLLRSYNCTLPIEIFHFSSELSKSDKSLLEDLSHLSGEGAQVTVRLVEGLQKGEGWKAFHIKGAAIQQSSFNEILYLDTDSYPLRNPNEFFESKYWENTGLLLWPDYTKSHATNPLWRLVGMPCRNEFEGESGQIFIDRTRHQDLLWLVEFFALHHDDFYGFMGGDRDSFRAAALLLGKSWHGPGRLNAAAGNEGTKLGGHTMLQADMKGRWAFVHANLIKHSQFRKPLWTKIHTAKNDKFQKGTTYGSIEGANAQVGDGTELRVVYDPGMVTKMTPFEGFVEENAVVREDWDSYEELRGFEEKWFRFGGAH